MRRRRGSISTGNVTFAGPNARNHRSFYQGKVAGVFHVQGFKPDSVGWFTATLPALAIGGIRGWGGGMEGVTARAGTIANPHEARCVLGLPASREVLFR